MKTKAKSYRFDENDLALAMAKSGIQKTQKLMDFLLAEYVRELKPQFQPLPKDYVEVKAIKKISNGVVSDLFPYSRPLSGEEAEVLEKTMIEAEFIKDTLTQLEAAIAAIPDKTKGLGKKLAEHLQRKINALKGGNK
jgi:hypothetical protein